MSFRSARAVERDSVSSQELQMEQQLPDSYRDDILTILEMTTLRPSSGVPKLLWWSE